MLFLAYFLGLELFVSSSSDVIERTDMEGVEVVGRRETEEDSRQATVREETAVSRGEKLCRTLMFYA